MKNVLITGAGGFIGSKLAERILGLVAVGDVESVVGIARDVDPWLQRGQMRVCIGDICDYDFVRRVISDNEIDTIFHLAASAIVRISAADPMSAYRTNVMGTVSVLEAARSVGKCKSIVVASSDKAYGDHDTLPYLETHPLQPKNTYDTSKACMDMISRSYATNYGMPVVVTRCSNVYGPGDRNLSRIIPNTIRRLAQNADPVLYSDIENMEREFIYIDDVIDAYIELAMYTKFNKDYWGEAYNIGGTGPVKIRELVEQICKIMNSLRSPQIVQRDPNFIEIQKQYIDAGKLSKDCGWRPMVDLQEGLKRTIDGYLCYLNTGNWV